MKLLFIRHADPDYKADSLTQTGWQEAQALSERLCGIPVDYFYCSPLGRARDTASFTLEQLGKQAEVLDWLQEFPPKVKRPDRNGEISVAWDWPPSLWTEEDAFYDFSRWADHPCFQEASVREQYDAVGEAFFALLAKHGYVHENRHFRVVRENHDTLCFFCHFGIEAVLLSHLFQISPMVLWHNFVALPSSATLAVSEEREQGTASFRINYFGDLSHLYARKMEPSFSARFCECWSDDTRHI